MFLICRAVKHTSKPKYQQRMVKVSWSICVLLVDKLILYSESITH